MAIGKSMNDKKTCYSCDVRASDIAGRGTFATRDIGAGEELFREASFLVSRKVSRRRLDCSIPHSPTPADDAPTEVSSALRKQICVSLSAISIQHKHCPPSVRLVPTDTGGTLSGSEDTYWFARAYAASSSATRAAVLELDTFGGSESHAVFEVVRAESHILRQLDPNLLSIPTNELECAIQRQVVSISVSTLLDEPPLWVYIYATHLPLLLLLMFRIHQRASIQTTCTFGCTSMYVVRRSRRWQRVAEAT